MAELEPCVPHITRAHFEEQRGTHSTWNGVKRVPIRIFSWHYYFFHILELLVLLHLCYLIHQGISGSQCCRNDRLHI